MGFRGVYAFRKPTPHTPFILSRQSALYQPSITAKLDLQGRCSEKRVCAQQWGHVAPAFPCGLVLALSSRGKKRARKHQRNICVYCSKTLYSSPPLFDSLQESHYELISSLQGASWWKTLLKLCFSVLNLFKADCLEVIIISVIKSGNDANNNNIFIEHSNHKYLLDKYYVYLALHQMPFEFQSSSQNLQHSWKTRCTLKYF